MWADSGSPDFAEHDDVRILPQHAPQCLGEAEVDLGIDLNLVDPVDAALDRVFNGDQTFVGRVAPLQAGVECSRLSGTDRTDRQDDAIGNGDQLLDLLGLTVLEAEFLEVDKIGRVGHQSQDDAFTVDGGAGAESYVALFVEDFVCEVPVLGEAGARRCPCFP